MQIEQWKSYLNFFIVKIKGFNNPEDAKTLTNTKIFVDSKNIFSLNDDEYYWKDIIGCKVINLQNYNMGRIYKIIETGSHDVLEINSQKNDFFLKKKRLVPFIYKIIIKNINLKKKVIQIDWHPSF